MTTVLGILGAYIVSVCLAYYAGKRAGRSGSKISSLKTEVKLREKYEEIDNRVDDTDAVSLVDRLR